MLISLLAALPACAQFSGGGWVAYQNPDAPPFVPGSLYDWTGFTVTSTQVAANGTSATYPGHPYASSSSIASSNVGGNTNQSITYSTSGSATYEWLWTPTGSNKSAPPPSLYVLAKESGGLSLAPNAVGRTSGLSGKATLNFSSSVPAYNFGPLAPVTQYKAMPASGGKISTVAINAALSGTLSGTTPTGDVGYTSYLISTVAFPIVLAGPDPMGRPDLGDGSNQFVYDATTPDGLLNFPGIITAVGATAADTAWIMRDPQDVIGPHVGFTLDLPAETVAKGWNLYDQTIVSSVSASSIAVKYGSYNGPSSSMGDGFLYAGLPKMNSDFGNHLVTMTVDGKPSQQAHIQTFFSLKASNWPGSDGKTPNWFHYWSMTSAYYGTPTYENGPRCQTVYDSVSGKWVAYIDNDTASGTFPGYENATGIDAFAWECRHKAQHVENFVAWWGNTPLPGTSSAYDPSKDADGDSIPDRLEHDLGMKFHPELGGYDPTALVTPKLQDHFHYGTDYNDDEDYTQHMQRQNHPWTNGSADKEDWASPGHQKK